MLVKKLHQPRIWRMHANFLRTNSRKFVQFAARIVLTSAFSACGLRTETTPLSPVEESIPIKAFVQFATSTPAASSSHIGDSVPSALRKQVEGLNVNLDVSSSPTSGSNQKQIQWVYALVAPFPTVT